MSLTEKGWPRPIVSGHPVPWAVDTDNFGKLDDERHQDTIFDRLCQVCGNGHRKHASVWLFVVDAEHREETHEVWAQAMDEGLLHERCARLAYDNCPELRRLHEAGTLVVLEAPLSRIESQVDDDGAIRFVATYWKTVELEVA